MRFEHRRFDDLPRSTLERLHELTNDPLRGDVRDGSTGTPGSLFREQLDDRLCGDSFPNTHVVLARSELRIAGWCLVTRHDIDPETGRKLVVPSASVGFYVHPDFRRRGLGSSLIQEALEVARKTGVGRLMANPWNQRSHSFFLANGFVDTSEYVPGYCKGIAVLDVGVMSAAAAV